MPGRTVCEGTHTETIHRAAWVVVDPWNVLADGWVQTVGGTIRSVGSGRRFDPAARVLDHGEGVLFPLPVNAHVHLELCALKDRLPTGKGFLFWVENLIRERSVQWENLPVAAKAGLQDLASGPCGAIGEVSTLGITRDLFHGSGLSGIWFQEYLGDVAGKLVVGSERPEEGGWSVAGHGPHTTSPGLLRALKRWTRSRGMPFSIHVAESEEEVRFLSGASSSWKAFLLSRGIDFAQWDLGAPSPVMHLVRNGILDSRTILVHVLYADDGDLEAIRRSGSRVCLCPRSNWNLHQRIPDASRMMRHGIPLCLGTDSLASVDSLSMMDEMAFFSKHAPKIGLSDIFAMATIGGAETLGVSGRLGTLTSGKSAEMAFMPVQAGSVSQVMDALVRSRLPSRRISSAPIRAGCRRDPLHAT